MKTSSRFLIGTAVIAAALFAVLSIVYARFLPAEARPGLAFGLLVSIANVVGSYYLMRWGGRRGDKEFLQAFVGGMLGRLLVIGLALATAHLLPVLDFRGTLYAILAAFFPLAGFEVYCVVRELDLATRQAKANRTSGRTTPEGSAIPTRVVALAVVAIAGAALLVPALSSLSFAEAEQPAGQAQATGEHGAPGTTAAHAEGGAHGEGDVHVEGGAPGEHAEADAHGAAAHGEGAAAGEHGAHDAHGGGDVFTELFHHLNDEVVIPIEPIALGNRSIDISVTKLVVMIWIGCALNLAIFVTLARKSRALVPTGAFHNLFESLVLFVKRDMVEEIMGHHLAPKFTPYFLTVFFFILLLNLLGLVPFMHTATANIAVTASLATLTFLMMQFAGIREQGFVHYVKSIVPPGIPLWLYPVMVPVEILGQFTKPFALTIRLFANMTAGHVVILSLFGLLFFFKNILIAPAVLGFVLFVTALEILVAFLQAYIFTFLSILFVNACAHPEH